jgi:hypothetical protein
VSYAYIGPKDIREVAARAPRGTPIRSRADLATWIAAHERVATYTVALDGTLTIAPRNSEHVACAGGERVLAAGELFFTAAAAVAEASNLSTGYCPEPSCWTALAAALDRAAIPRPAALSHAFEFRRCEACGQRNLVKDEVYACAVCDAELQLLIGPPGTIHAPRGVQGRSSREPRRGSERGRAYRLKTETSDPPIGR